MLFLNIKVIIQVESKYIIQTWVTIIDLNQLNKYNIE